MRNQRSTCTRPIDSMNKKLPALPLGESSLRDTSRSDNPALPGAHPRRIEHDAPPPAAATFLLLEKEKRRSRMLELQITNLEKHLASAKNQHSLDLKVRLSSLDAEYKNMIQRQQVALKQFLQGMQAAISQFRDDSSLQIHEDGNEIRIYLDPVGIGCNESVAAQDNQF